MEVKCEGGGWMVVAVCGFEDFGLFWYQAIKERCGCCLPKDFSNAAEEAGGGTRGEAVRHPLAGGDIG
jgi:hypothetical protein